MLIFLVYPLLQKGNVFFVILYFHQLIKLCKSCYWQKRHLCQSRVQLIQPFCVCFFANKIISGGIFSDCYFVWIFSTKITFIPYLLNHFVCKVHSSTHVVKMISLWVIPFNLIHTICITCPWNIFLTSYTCVLVLVI